MNRGIANGELASIAIDTPEDMVDKNIAEPAMGYHDTPLPHVPPSDRLKFGKGTGKDLVSGLALGGREICGTGPPNGKLLRIMCLNFSGGKPLPLAIPALAQLWRCYHCQAQGCPD